jgi:xylulokinase
MAFIGLDVGTAGVKATVVERTGETVLTAYREYDLRLPRPGWVEIRPDDVWAATRAVLSEASSRAGKAIEAIATASFGEAAVLLGADDRPVCDSIFYTDPRGADELTDLCKRIDRAEIERRTGMPVNHMYTLPKLIWLRKNRPALLEKTRKILPYASYIGFMLTGEAATDGSLASRTLLFDRGARDWDAGLCEACGIDRALLPRYAPAGTSVAPILPGVARELGVSEGAMIVSGVHDQVAAALGAGVFEPGDACDGIGSAECLIAPLPLEPDLRGMFAANICAEPYLGPGREVALAFTNAAGTALKWYRDTFERELAAACAARGENVYAVLNDGLADSPSPLLFLPYLAGTGTPHMDARATGMLAGLTLSTTRADIYRAIYEGMNFEIRMNLELLRRTGFRIGALTAAGGGASEAALRIKADILKTPIWTLKNSQSGTVGLAMLCGLALGEYASFEEAAKALVRRDKRIEPRENNRAQYEEKYEQYLRMYPASRSIYGRG